MNKVLNFQFQLNKDEVLKAMGCDIKKEAFKEVSSVYDELYEDIVELLEPAALFTFKTRTEEFSINELNECSHIVYCLLTVGVKITAEIQKYFNNEQYLEGMLLDTMADFALNEYSNQLFKLICCEAKKSGKGLTCKYSPGNAEFQMKYQENILKMVDGEKLLGVGITNGFMLNPVKSVAFIFGSDVSLSIPVSDHECSRCTSYNCRMRKEPYIDKKINDKVNITILCGKQKTTIKASKHKSIFDSLIENKVGIIAPCGGNGTCGKCKVKLNFGKVRIVESKLNLSEELLKEGWYLACSTFPEEDCEIRIENHDKGMQILETFKYSKNDKDSRYIVANLNIDKNTLSGRSLIETINNELNSQYDFSIRALNELGEIFKVNKNEFALYLIIKDNKVISATSNKGNSEVYGIAIDIGTTTVAFNLINLITAEVVKANSLLNSQKQFGADVISRIQFSNINEVESLKNSIKNDLIKGIKEICNLGKVPTNEIYHIAITGNTTMNHFLLGLPCESLALFPFNTITTSMIETSFSELFQDNLLDSTVSILPGVSAYVGSDIVSGMLNCGFHQMEKTCILLDIGTNGEIVIGNKTKALCLATAAGPAFEGANITCGVGNIKGAICSVDMRDNIVEYKTIGNTKPVGICGSAVVDITAACINNSIIDETGRIDKHCYANEIVKIAEDSNGSDIIFEQSDIREVQLAKSAVCSGLEILIKEFACDYNEIDTVFLAGGFGNYMNIESAIKIGLIPKQLKDKIKCVGNSSLGGAVDFLINKNSNEIISYILEKTKYIDISSNKNFNDLFIDNILFDI